MLWIVGITNAINLVDGLDGLAAGVGAIIGATLTVIAWQAGSAARRLRRASRCVGALLGFLPYNFCAGADLPGRHGLALHRLHAGAARARRLPPLSLLTFVVPLLALAVPILDTGLSILRRVRSARPLFRADRLHMHHRLLAFEGSQRAAVLQFYLLTAAFCLIALSFTRLEGDDGGALPGGGHRRSRCGCCGTSVRSRSSERRSRWRRMPGRARRRRSDEGRTAPSSPASPARTAPIWPSSCSRRATRSTAWCAVRAPRPSSASRTCASACACTRRTCSTRARW